MDFIFHKEKLERILCDFYGCTGIAIVLYDTAMEVVATSPAMTGFCSCIHAQKQCEENCANSDRSHIVEVSNTRQSCRYICHAGLTEVIVPIFYESVLIAYLQIGQFRDEKQIEPPYRQLRQVAAQCGRSVDELLALYQEVPIISDEKLASLCNIMDVLIKTFWHDGLIYYKRSMLSIKIDQYITDHLSEKITTARLCGEFFLSKNALYQLFEKEMGMTVNDFIVQKRLRLACDYLASNRNINVTQVAALCGFPDYNYFIRLFKKQYGVTPLQYRKSKLGD